MTKVFDILAYGDSLTWGADPGMNRRLPHEARWPSVAQAALGERARIVNAGLSGRTTQFDDFGKGYDRNGLRTLPLVLAMHKPLDLIVLMFGANDLKPALCGKADGTVDGLSRMIEIIRDANAGHDHPPAILIIAPPHLRNLANGAPPKGGRSIAESKRLAPLLEQLAEKTRCAFLDAATVADASLIDGVHLDARSSIALGQAIGRKIADMLSVTSAN
ncbi:hypothetical protein JP75_01095 [Devosia riboflavina]|uniref:SGNH hydrolase-type esterase domain-containing protein n=1 Tax=Devosia riboflavina TaxID=46914 RepID=A0A087M7C7_9HYPH|nr:SGNH/GDSL hydrolase family protein [Devosia riboflavina]KFL32780.1 hypothetical protein JP75_01095 [Devosia riboflavina]